MCRPVAVNIKYILEHWPTADWGDADTFRTEYLNKERAAQKIRDQKKTNLNFTKDKFPYKRLPMAHQQQAFLLSRDLTEFGLFMEQGTGKTKVVIDTAFYLWLKRKIDCLIIVAWPNGVHRNWIEYELELDAITECEAAWWSSNLTKKKRNAIDKVLNSDTSLLKIMAFNVEAFVSVKAKSYILAFLKRYRCMVVIDQSASIKNPAAKRTKFLIKEVAPLAAFRRILDGAPVAEGAGELFSQFKFLNQDIIGHDTYTAFKAEFCQIGYFNEIVGYKNLDELHRRIDGYSFRVMAKDCLDLPPITYKRWGFNLSANEMRIYNELKRENLACFTPCDLGDGVLEENLALVKNMRLQQIASGWFPDSNNFKSINQPDKSARLEALLNLIAGLDGKALIYSRFVADLVDIQRWLGSEAVSYHGAISEGERAENKRKFMQDSSVKYFIGQPRTAGIGHTLTAAKHIIFYSNDPSLRFREECEKRAHRKGLEKTLGDGESLMVWDLIAEKTHDIKIVNALRRKKDVSVEIMKDPVSFFLVEQ